MRLNQYRFELTLFILVSFFSFLEADPCVQARLWGRLGNNFFIVAAATSLALENNTEATFPDLIHSLTENNDLVMNYNVAALASNYQNIFTHLNTSDETLEPRLVYREPSFNYTPIPYSPNMLLEGWFQSEKYFSKYKAEIIDLFAPTERIKQYLNHHYSDILKSSDTVSIHLRAYNKENPALDKVFPTYGREYVEKAMSLFPENSWFIVFSDQPEWAKEELSGIQRRMTFIEGEPDYHDLYLMSACKHHIISNSSFSWWAAYLNKNPEKIVVVPPVWFCFEYNHNIDDLIPEEWITLK